MKKFTDFPKDVQEIAREMALAVNGGEWPRDYPSEAQRIGWALKAQWAMKKFGVKE